MTAFQHFTQNMDKDTVADFALWAHKIHGVVVRTKSTARLERLWRLYQYEILTEKHLPKKEQP
jgi:hypothetical protein